jgi:putative flippase GtrA
VTADGGAGNPAGLRESAGELLRFSAVGVVAFVIDAGTLQTALWLGLDPYSGRVVSYLFAATSAWAMNRRYTFRVGSDEGLAREWLAYLGANAVGGLINYGTYVAALWASDLARAWPVLAVAAGSVAGLFFNFAVNKFYVFRRTWGGGASAGGPEPPPITPQEPGAR